jgi:hypothetical protein
MAEPASGEHNPLPPELPPVEPPSARLIAQLFLVPGVIVMVIVVLWLAVNRLASSEQDWRALAVNLESPSSDLRWRSAFGLAQMLHVDQQRTKESGGPKLVTNPDLARRLASMLDRELKRGAPNDDVIKMQAYLAKTLSYFRVPEEVLPVLQQAITSDRDRDVRRNALAAIATIAYRESEAKTPLKNPELLSNILEASADSDPVIRQLAAYNLGLLGGEKAQERLESMLRDADENTRANAAIGLARQHSTAGLPVLKEMVKSAEGPVEAGSQGEYEQFVLLTNCITAIDRLTPELDAQQRSELVTLLKPATEHRESRVRIEAEKTVVDLQGAGGSK